MNLNRVLSGNVSHNIGEAMVAVLFMPHELIDIMMAIDQRPLPSSS